MHIIIHSSCPPMPCSICRNTTNTVYGCCTNHAILVCHIYKTPIICFNWLMMIFRSLSPSLSFSVRAYISISQPICVARMAPKLESICTPNEYIRIFSILNIASNTWTQMLYYHEPWSIVYIIIIWMQVWIEMSLDGQIGYWRQIFTHANLSDDSRQYLCLFYVIFVFVFTFVHAHSDHYTVLGYSYANSEDAPTIFCHTPVYLLLYVYLPIFGCWVVCLILHRR